jgi:hypothetical protein
MKNAVSKLLVTAVVGLCFSVPGHAQTGDVDPINDAAGILVPNSSSGSSGTLYTTVNEESSVLTALQATATGPNQYRTTITGSPIDFVVLRVIFPGYWLPPGDLICQNGAVKVYRNSTCVTTISGGSSGCFPYTNGNFARVNYNPTRKCKRGVGFCVEVRQIAWTRTVYFDNQCTTPIRIDTGTDFLCR